MIPRFPVYLFDLDGTLLDSAQDICGAVQQVLDVTDAPPVTFEFLKSYVGRHLLDLFIDIFPHYSPEQIDQLIQQYRAVYPARGHKLTRMYPGVMEGLTALPGRKSIATTKGTASTRLILEQFGLAGYFDHVQGTDGFPCKPAPDVIFNALNALRAATSECLMVGDSAADMEAGRRAGVKTCAVRYGYGNPEDLARFEPDFWIEDLREL
ncbi:MAG: HAD family hydrolase [Acidobacteriia bacterium]|nr:HAD family hydrolase [Terriglobia bacterium]